MEGNQMKMREVLVQCERFLGNVSRHGHPKFCFGDQCTACNGADELMEVVVGALAAPPRNFERYDTAEAAWNAYDEWVESYEAKGETPPYNEFGWLYALANQEMRGENHGSK